MKKLEPLKHTLLSLLLITALGCDKNGPRDLSQSPTVTPQVTLNDDGEPTVDLIPINSSTWNDPELEAAEQVIREERVQRVQERLAPIKEEVMKVSDPVATFKTDGSKEVVFNITYQGTTETTAFNISKDDVDRFTLRNFVFSEKLIVLQGICKDPEEGCYIWSMQISFFQDKTQFTQEYTVINNNKSKEAEAFEEIDLDVSTTSDVTDENSNVTPSTDELSEEQPFVQTSVNSLEAPGAESESVDFEDHTTDSSPTSPSQPTSPSLQNNTHENKPYVDLNSSPDQNPSPEIMSESPRINSLPDSTETAAAPSLSTKPLAPSSTEAPAIPSQEHELNIDTSTTLPPEENNELTGSVRPVARPDHFAEEFGVDHNGTNLIVGAADTAFPNIDDTGATEIFSLDSGETYPIGVASNSSDELLIKIQTHPYHQSKNYYHFKDGVHGRIVDSTQLDSRFRGAVVNPNNRDEQYGSGLTVDTLKYAVEKFHVRHPEVPVCINDLSLRRGGNIGGHGSHENGLDADISLPSTGNSCSGSFFKSYSHLDRVDDTFRQKNWEFVNLLLSTERVHGIFVDREMIRRLCTHVKKNITIERAKRDAIFKKLHHEDGHTRHYHVRMQCNPEQNIDCVRQGTLTGSTCR